MLATGATLVIDHAASPGSMVAASVIMGRLLFPFEQMIDGWRQWTHAMSACSRLRTLLAGASAGRSSVAVAAAHGRLPVESVSFVPPGTDRPILKNVRFALEPGDVLGIVGPSGAGKSSLARLLVGLWRPTAGGIYLDGHDVYTWERSSFGAQIGYLPQNAPCSTAPCARTSPASPMPTPPRSIAAAKRADVHEIIGRLPLGYETRVGDSGFRAFRRAAAAHRPRPRLVRTRRSCWCSTSRIPISTASASRPCCRRMREAKKAGTTIIVIAHRMSVMAAADKLLVLRDGIVEHFGPRGQVMQRSPSKARPAARRRSEDRPAAGSELPVRTRMTSRPGRLLPPWAAFRHWTMRPSPACAAPPSPGW